MSGDEKPLFVILSGEDIDIVGEALGYIETIKIINGKENQWFEKYAKEHPQWNNMVRDLEWILNTMTLFSLTVELVEQNHSVKEPTVLR
jgi:hypothetical protein